MATVGDTVVYDGIEYEVVFTGQNDGRDGDLLVPDRRLAHKKPPPFSLDERLKRLQIANNNKGRVLTVLRSQGPLVSDAIAEQTGLSESTVRNTIRTLMDNGFIASKPTQVKRKYGAWLVGYYVKDQGQASA